MRSIYVILMMCWNYLIALIVKVFITGVVGYIYIYIYTRVGLHISMCRAIWDRNCVLAQKQLQARPKGEHTDDQKSTKKSMQNELKLNATSTQHQAKYQPKISSKIDPDSTQHRPKIDPKSIQNQ